MPEREEWTKIKSKASRRNAHRSKRNSIKEKTVTRREN
jgi:hypothetical protein